MCASRLLSAALLVAAASDPVPSTAEEGGPTNVFPDKQPILRTFPPAAADQSAPGTGKFVIFTREEVGKEDPWDYIAGAWECIPSEPQRPITKRIEFCHTSWNATPLLDCFAHGNAHGLHPRFVRLKVEAPKRHFFVNLFDINYRTWEVKRIWTGPRLDAFGVLNDSIFCLRDTEWLQVHTETGAVTDGVPFIPLEIEEAFWLVKKRDDPDNWWTYDRDLQQFVGRFNPVDAKLFDLVQRITSRDGRCRALLLAKVPSGWSYGTLKAEILVQRADRSEDLHVPVELWALPGDGVRLHPISVHFQFIGQDQIEFRALSAVETSAHKLWIIQTATGAVSHSVNAFPPNAEPDIQELLGVPVPDYLREYVRDIPHFGREALACAFVVSQGLVPAIPTDAEGGVSLDGRHIIFKAGHGPLKRKLIYGDLVTKKVVQWDAPLELDGPAVEFVWVVTP